MTSITCDVEASNLLNDETIDYTRIPYRLKDNFKMHCLVLEKHDTGEFVAFYDGPKIELDGTRYEVEGNHSVYVLEDYKPIEHTHYQLDKFKRYIKKNKFDRVIMHNGINYDLLVCKLFFDMDYTVGPDTWVDNEIVIEDTLVMSKALNADRFGGHSLDNLGKKVGLDKIQFRKHLGTDVRFLEFAPDMLYYCIRDVQVNTAVYRMLLVEQEDWDWAGVIELEKAIAEIVTRQEHRGFAFNKPLAESNIKELDMLMEERRARVEPALPPREATKKFLSDNTPPASQLKITTAKPPKVQFKGDGTPSAHLIKFVEKVGGELTEDDGTYELLLDGEVHSLPYKADVEVGRELAVHMVNFVKNHDAKVNKTCTHITIFGEKHTLPLPREPLRTEMVATINDSAHIKNWLVGLGWTPTEYSEKDLTVNSKKEKYQEDALLDSINRYVDQTLATNFCKDRCENLKATPASLKSKLIYRTKGDRGVKVLTNPSFTVGQEKEMCPALARIAEKFPYAKDIVEYLTYRHRRNSILGGNLGLDEEEEATKGFIAHVRADGRIPTPADSCGAATARMTHRIVANIPRNTSPFGPKMRGMFGVSKGMVQLGYDFDSLEAKIESHYTYDYQGGVAYGISLTAEKPNDCHSVLARKVSDLLGIEFPRQSAKPVKYGCSYNAQPPRIAKTIGCSLNDGQVIFDAFWEQASPLADRKNTLLKYWETEGLRKFLLGLDGRKLPVRSKGNVINTEFQSGGVICAKRAMLIHDRMLKEEGLIVDFFKESPDGRDYCQQLIAYHDESQLEVPASSVKFKLFKTKEKAEKWKAKKEAKTGKVWSDVGESSKGFYIGYCRAGELSVMAVKLSGEYYNLNVELTAGYMLGNSWANCH